MHWQMFFAQRSVSAAGQTKLFAKGGRLACSRRSISACRFETVSIRRWRRRCAALLLPSRLHGIALREASTARTCVRNCSRDRHLAFWDGR